jgi:hypothetical protein
MVSVFHAAVNVDIFKTGLYTHYHEHDLRCVAITVMDTGVLVCIIMIMVGRFLLL